MLNEYNNKVIETEEEYTIMVGYKAVETEYGISEEYDVAFMSVLKEDNELKELKVKEEFQGKGIATKLIKKAIELGVNNLKAEAYGKGMAQEDLQNFYKKHGFVEKGVWGHAMIMELI